MADFILGMNAKIYYGAAGTTASTELTNVRDVTVTLEAGEADVTTRANDGWRATAPTLKECSVEFEMVWKTTDAGFTAVKAAFLANSTIALLVLSEAGGEGIDGDFSITNFSRNEALEEAIKIRVAAGELATVIAGCQYPDLNAHDVPSRSGPGSSPKSSRMARLGPSRVASRSNRRSPDSAVTTSRGGTRASSGSSLSACR
jgi:hypothetical protein